LLEAVVGSTAHGLTVAGSDVDLLAVHLAPTGLVLGLNGSVLVTESRVSQAPDRTSHELGKFVSLALAANPTILEALYAEEYRTMTPAGEQLVAARSAFLSTRAVRSSYGGYARSQLNRLLRRGDGSFSSDTRSRVEKHARHCRRLLLQGTQLLTTGELTLDVSAHREMLFAAGRIASTHPERFAAEFDAALAEFDALPSVLPDAPDREGVDLLMTAIRLADLRENTR
jgi:predicted nucleotidyltransferase